MRYIVHFIVMSALLGCGTAFYFTKNTPDEGLGLIYIHQYCTGKYLGRSGPEVWLDDKYIGRLVENGYMELSVLPGNYSLVVNQAGYLPTKVDLHIQENNSYFVQYSFTEEIARPELVNLIEAIKSQFKEKQYKWASLDEYPEFYAESTMESCQLIPTKD